MITWKNIKPEVGPDSLSGYIGKWKIFSIQWGASKSDEGDYVLRSSLPGIKEYFRVKDNNSGKIKADEILKYWIKEAKI